MTRQEREERAALAGAVTYRMVTAALWAFVRVALILIVSTVALWVALVLLTYVWKLLTGA